MAQLIRKDENLPPMTLHGAYTHPYDLRFKPCRGWTRAITLLDDHRLFRSLPQFATWTKADHVREAEYALRASVRVYEVYYATVRDAEQTYGNHGPLISGIVRDHFPEELKDTLRELCRRGNRERNRSYTHWRAAGRTVGTWRRLLELYTDK